MPCLVGAHADVGALDRRDSKDPLEETSNQKGAHRCQDSIEQDRREQVLGPDGAEAFAELRQGCLDSRGAAS